LLASEAVSANERTQLSLIGSIREPPRSVLPSNLPPPKSHELQYPAGVISASSESAVENTADHNPVAQLELVWNNNFTMQIEDHLRALEEHLLNLAVRRDSDAVAPLLSDDFLEFGASGRVFDKASILEDLKNEQPRPASLLTDFAIRELSPTIILATYRATRFNAEGEPILHSRRSSIWAHVNGQWQITFHQGTPIPPPQNPDAPTQK
jgi:hypothetical protein